MIPITRLEQDYSIPIILKGGWQLAGGHGIVDREKAISDMFAFYDAGLTTFDCADIYTGVEELIGQFIKRLSAERGQSAVSKLHIHTKYVPDKGSLQSLTAEQVEETIQRSIRRLGVRQLDMVQFHWWDYDVERYELAALTLQSLQQKGYIKHIGLTNFDAKHAAILYNRGLRLLTNQVQYSVLDRRPENTMVEFCKTKGIKLICYGTVAGGLLSNKNLGLSESELTSVDNRSYTKYKVIIDDLGGWSEFQAILKQLKEIGSHYGASISEVSMAYVLHKPQVAAIVVGARDASHVDSLQKVSCLKIQSEHLAKIDDMIEVSALKGDIYGLERHTDRHAKIMKYNLNKDIS